MIGRPFLDDKLYMPLRLFESDVILQYLDWWKGSVLAKENAIECIVTKKHSKTHRKRVPQGFTFEHNWEEENFVKEVNRETVEGFNFSNEKKGKMDRETANNPIDVEDVDYDKEKRLNIAEMLARKSKSKGDDEPLMNKKNDNLLVPPGFLSKHIRVEAVENVEEDRLPIAERWSHNSKSEMICGSQCSSHAAPDDAAGRKMESMVKNAEMSMQSKSLGVGEDADVSRTKCPLESSRHTEGKMGKSDIIEILASKLEARVSKLERVVLG